MEGIDDDIIDDIMRVLTDDLSYMDETSRSTWTRMRKLCFEREFLKNHVERRGLDVVSFVDAVLSRHEGPLKCFHLSSDIAVMKDETTDICRCMPLLAKKKIQEIHFSNSPSWTLNTPSRILNSCSTLTRLTLGGCKLGSFSKFSGLTSLEQLHLTDTTTSSTTLEAVVSRSPVLRCLSIADLTVYYERGNRNHYVVIDAPKLESLTIKCAGDFWLREYPILKSACFRCYYNELVLHFGDPEVGQKRTLHSFYNLSRAMPSVSSLLLDSSVLLSLDEGGVLFTHPAIFRSLKHPEFDELNIQGFLEKRVFCLIQRLPNLETLTIHAKELHEDGLHDDNVESLIDFYRAKENTLSSLLQVTFYQLMGTAYEVTLIKAILRCCPMIKAVKMAFSFNIELDRKSWLVTELESICLPKSASLLYGRKCPKDTPDQ